MPNQKHLETLTEIAINAEVDVNSVKKHYEAMKAGNPKIAFEATLNYIQILSSKAEHQRLPSQIGSY